MKKVAKKDIVSYVKYGEAVDITSHSFAEVRKLMKEHHLDVIKYSSAIYGINAALLTDENGTLYAITSRGSTLFQVL